MRILAVDYGDARTGIAISDFTGLLAGVVAVIRSRKMDEVVNAIVQAAEEYRVEELVVGLPKNMDGTEGPRAEQCRAFAATLKARSNLPTYLWDERRTTIEAHSILHENGKKMKVHKDSVDAVAASLILEGYLSWKQQDR